MNSERDLSLAARAGYGVARLAAFAALGALTARRVSATPEAAIVGAVGGVFLTEILLLLMAGAARALCGRLAAQGVGRFGTVKFGRAIRQSFVTMVPFALLALVAEAWLGWDAVQAFVVAGVTASAGAAALELGRRGASQLRAAIVTTAGGIVFASSWILISVLVQQVSGRQP